MKIKTSILGALLLGLMASCALAGTIPTGGTLPNGTFVGTQPVAILDGSGNQITSFGGGGGNAAASATGSAVPGSAGYTGLNFGGVLKGWTGDANGYGDVNVMSSVLPTGAATSALQPGFGTAGTPSANVGSVQGVASGTPIISTTVDGSGAPLNYTYAKPVGLDNYPVKNNAGLPVQAVPVSCSVVIAATATATCTLPAASGKTTYLDGYDWTVAGGTVGALVTLTITGPLSGTISHLGASPTGVTTANEYKREFTHPISGSAANTAIVGNAPAGPSGQTTGGTLTLNGYQL